jgi:(+)-trans-carveol dehydrogenase
MGRFDGKVALITGAARGQGRSHAVRLAQEGADIVAVDLAQPIQTVSYGTASQADLAETVKLVEAEGRRIIARDADVRDQSRLDQVVAESLQEFGRIDVICANAGIISYGRTWELTEEQWQDVIDVNLTGVWHTVKASIPAIISGGGGGSITITSSGAGMKGFANCAHYTAAKHGLIGLTRSLAIELAPHLIRVNAVLPSTVRTPMVINEDTFRRFRPDIAEPTLEDALPRFGSMNLLPTPMLEPRDVSEALLWLASDEARYVTGIALPVDAGTLIK